MKILKVKKVTYLHILWHADLKFNPYFVEMINDEPHFFNSEEHLFITPHENVYNQLSHYENVILAGEETDNLINEFGYCADWIFVHAINCSKLKLLFTRSVYSRKVIWRTWGHDIRDLDTSDCNFASTILKKAAWYFYLKKVRSFHAFGVGNHIDEVNVHNTFGEMKYYTIPYSYDKNRLHRLENIRTKMDVNAYTRDVTNPLRILIGHSGSMVDNHMDALKKLMKYKNENIKVCLILSYGGPRDYIEKVREFAVESFAEKVEIIENFMDFYQFADYLSNIDIAIFDQLFSIALGNLSLLIYFKKMIYFNSNGQFVESFKIRNCKYKTCDEIENMTYKEFVNNKLDRSLEEKYNGIMSSDVICKKFKAILENLAK